MNLESYSGDRKTERQDGREETAKKTFLIQVLAFTSVTVRTLELLPIIISQNLQFQVIDVITGIECHGIVTLQFSPGVHSLVVEAAMSRLEDVNTNRLHTV